MTAGQCDDLIAAAELRHYQNYLAERRDAQSHPVDPATAQLCRATAYTRRRTEFRNEQIKVSG